MACLILPLTASLVMWSLYEMPSSFLKHLISVVCDFFGMSAVNVQVMQAYNSTEITRECISLIFELTKICLWFKIVFSLASAAFVCAILDSTSGLEPWSVTTASNFSLLILMSMLIRLALLVISVVFSALISMPKTAEVLSRRSTSEASSSSFPARPSVSSAKHKLVIVLNAECFLLIF